MPFGQMGFTERLPRNDLWPFAAYGFPPAALRLTTQNSFRSVVDHPAEGRSSLHKALDLLDRLLKLARILDHSAKRNIEAAVQAAPAVALPIWRTPQP
jgi:hypothetical protein